VNGELTIGIDVGGTRVKAALIDASGALMNQLNVPSAVGGDYQAVLGQLIDVADRLSREAEDNKPVGIGLGVAGLIDTERQRVLTSPNCASLNGRPLSGDISQGTGLPAVMDNDANYMALGEGFCGAARGSRHYIAITLGTGVGGAVISNGVLIRGVNGGGELGHIPIDRMGPRCSCGSHGCLEAYVGRSGIQRYISRHMPQHKERGLKELSKLAARGDGAAIQLFGYIGTTVGILMAGLVNLFSPELIVIGGGIAEAGDILLGPLEAELRRRAFDEYLPPLQIKPAELGNWAGVIGAATAARIMVNEQ